jgi:hypothetical protein
MNRQSNREKVSKTMSLKKRRRVAIIAGTVLAAVVILSATLVGSGAVFTSTSANPSNVFTAGTFTHSNSKDAAAIATMTNMKPGDVATGTVTIKNTGSLAGDFTLTMKKIADTAGTNGGSLYGVLKLQVLDGATEVYNGNLKDFTTKSLGTFNADATHTYTFNVTFPDGGTPTSNTTGDNAYQGGTTTVEFDWSAVQK